MTRQKFIQLLFVCLLVVMLVVPVVGTAVHSEFISDLHSNLFHTGIVEDAPSAAIAVEPPGGSGGGGGGGG